LLSFCVIFPGSGDGRGGDLNDGTSEGPGGESTAGGAGAPSYLSGRGALARGSLGSGRTARSASKQSLLDLVGSRLGVSGGLSLTVICILTIKSVRFIIVIRILISSSLHPLRCFTAQQSTYTTCVNVIG